VKLIQNVADEARSLQNNIVAWRRELHQIPEVGLETPLTASYVVAKLRGIGIACKSDVGGHGVVGLIEGGGQGNTIALRADMDGLAIREETGLPFASTNGKMHACGHDAHTAMLLGAAKILYSCRNQFTGKVKLIFQPGEEGPGGAKPMIDDGVLENPKVEAIIGLHCGAIFKEIGVGQVGISYGSSMACIDRFLIKIKGSGCHGAMPDTGVDPIVITGQILTALQTIVSRETKPVNPTVVSIGKIHGGSAYNIIPDEVELEGTIRSVKQDDREKIARRLEEIVAGITKGMRGDYEYRYIFGYPPLVNNVQFTRFFVRSARKIVAEKDIIEILYPTMAGEDMAFFLERVPGTYFFLGAGNIAKNIVYPHHSSRFDVDEDVFWIGSALLAQVAVDWLNQ
jgi:amidohydrolase